MSLQIRIKVPSSSKVVAKLKKIHSPEFLRQVQTEVVEKSIFRLIRSGQSPVEGFGRFVQYKDKDSYPAGEKSVTPVNLTLSGAMLRLYAARRVDDKTISIGIIPEASDQIKSRAKANNMGTYDLEGKKLDRAARRRIQEANLPLFREARGGKRKRSVQEIARANKGVPARRFIPVKGESFTVSVIRKMKDLYTKRVRSLLSKK